MISRRLSVAILAGGLIVAGMLFWAVSGRAAPGGMAVPEDRAARLGLVPHKALYDIRLISAHSGSQILNISGKMYFEWKPVCEAWTTSHRFDLVYEYADAPSMRITSDFTTFEPFDGSTFDFTSRRMRDGEPYQELRGQGRLDEAGKGEAIYTMPAHLEFDLPQGSLFPMGHTLGLMEAVRSGKTFFAATVFDGSDEDGPVEINAIVGKKVNVMTQARSSPAVDVALLNTPAWNVRMAFFPLIKAEASADYEMDLILHDNGIISDMTIEYEDFTVTQKLVALEKVDAEGCTAAAKPGGSPKAAKKPAEKKN